METSFIISPEELTVEPDNSSNSLSSFVAPTEAGMRFPAIQTMGRYAVTSSSEHVPCGNTNSNSNDITNITSIENTRLVAGSIIVDGAMTREG